MNERIKELLEQAGGIEHDDDGNEMTAILVGKDLEKFAKLIVQECMWKIMQRKEEAIDNDWRVDEAMSAALLDISEHFGVEE